MEIPFPTGSGKSRRMSDDAFAGFLRLLLTPIHRRVELTPDVLAYLAYVEEVEPLSLEVRARMERGDIAPPLPITSGMPAVA